MTTFYDTHAHLDYPEYASEVEGAVERAAATGIRKIVAISTTLDSSRRAIALAERFPAIRATIGWHPGDVMEAPDDIRDELRQLAKRPRVAAIGEAGLDYYRLPSHEPGGTEVDDRRYKTKQAEIFQQQLEVAAETGLNMVIHQRESLEATLEQFEPFADRVKAVFHCFVSDAAVMERVLAMGSLVSFTGIVTFKNAQTVRDTVAATPMGKFMLETDSPYLAPVPYRGKRCEPAYVKETAAMVAEVKGCSLEELSEATCAAAEAFFRGL